MTALITLTTAGADTGPFDLYSDLDGYTTKFETNVPKASLVSGYTSTVVPDFTNYIRLISVGNCTSYIDILVPEVCTQLISFDYKGGPGNVILQYRLCGDPNVSSFNFTGLIGSGGGYVTHQIDPDVGEPTMCIEASSLVFVLEGSSIHNVNNFQYSQEVCSL